jgi:hypothetical protein
MLKLYTWMCRVAADHDCNANSCVLALKMVRKEDAEVKKPNKQHGARCQQ